MIPYSIYPNPLINIPYILNSCTYLKVHTQQHFSPTPGKHVLVNVLIAVEVIVGKAATLLTKTFTNLAKSLKNQVPIKPLRVSGFCSVKRITVFDSPWVGR